MTVDEFLNHPIVGRGPYREIDLIIKQWDEESKSQNQGDLAGTSSMLAALGLDAAQGDGLLNQLSPDLLHSMNNLMGDKAETYDQARQLIAKKIANGDAAFSGFVNKIKGQLGEDHFALENSDYVLAVSKSQEGVDAVRGLGTDFVEAVQVKMYQNANDVIRHMHIVQEKVNAGLTIEGSAIDKLSFAVPHNIVESVREKAALHADIAGIDIISIGTTSTAVADIVKEAGDHVAHPFLHVASDSLSTIGFMLALDALTNTYLYAKGKRTFSDVTKDFALKAPIGALAIGASKTTATVLSLTGISQAPIVVPIVSALIIRKILTSWYENRSSYFDRLKSDIRSLALLCDSIELMSANRLQLC